MKVEVYSLLGVLQDVAYCAGQCDSAAKAVDSATARDRLLQASGLLKGTADDIRTMFDGFEDGCPAVGEIKPGGVQ